MPLTNLLPDPDSQAIPVNTRPLDEKLRNASALQQTINDDLITLHETPAKKKLRLFLYYLFVIIAGVTTLISQVLPNFVRFGRDNKEKQAMDVTNWVLGGISVVTGILAWLLSGGPETRKLSSLSSKKKEKIHQLELTLSDIHVDCNAQFANEETHELYSSTDIMLTKLLGHLRTEKESSIASTCEELKQINSIVTTINAIDRLQKKSEPDALMIELDENLLCVSSSRP